MPSPARPFQTLDATSLSGLMTSRPESGYTLVDVRTPAEYGRGHLPGARLIPLGELPDRLGEIDPDRDAVFYCAAGGRSKAAATLAAESGRFRKRILNLAGGIRSWQGTKLPDFPPLKAFEAAQTFEDALLAAMGFLKAAWLFYVGLGETPPQRTTCELWRELSKAKREQARFLYGFLKKERDGEPSPPFAELFESIEGDVLASGEKIETLIAWAKDAHRDCHDLAEFCLELEREAWDLYRNLAFDARDKREEGAFLDLSSRQKRIVLDLAGRLGSMVFSESH